MSYLPHFDAMAESLQGARFVGLISSCVGTDFNVEQFADTDYFIAAGAEGNGVLQRIWCKEATIRSESWMFVGADGSPDMIVRADLRMERRGVRASADAFTRKREVERRVAYGRTHDVLQVRSTHIDRADEIGLGKRWIQNMLGLKSKGGRRAEVVPIA